LRFFDYFIMVLSALGLIVMILHFGWGGQAWDPGVWIKR